MVSIGILLFAMFVAQNCSDVNLQPLDEVNLLSLSKNPFRLDPPFDYSQPRRLIFLVDMSYSMISGSCPQDVDAGIIFPGSGIFVDWDPNKSSGSPLDHRATGIDCIVNQSLPISRSSVLNFLNPLDYSQRPLPFYSTHYGMDYERHRLDLLRNWIDQALANPSAVVQDTKVMILPVTGGKNQQKLYSLVTAITGNTTAFQFVDLNSPRVSQIISALRNEHDRNLQTAGDQDEYRYETRTMGVSSIGPVLKDTFLGVSNDMKALLAANRFAFSKYHVVHISDGKVTPIKSHINSVLQFYGQCGVCVGNPDNCTGLCSNLMTKMSDSWGSGDENEINRIDYNYSILHGLPAIMGGSHLQTDFVQLKPARFASIYPANETTYFDQLKTFFDGRNVHHKVWPSNDGTPPFRPLGDASTPLSYKVTHLFMLNSNARLDTQGNVQVDSDGDGLTDIEEAQASTNPIVQRTHGYCLDSIYVDPAFQARCHSFVSTQSCDAKYDADFDGLNECEESILASNPSDFDTDDDGLPDSLEWLYGYNILKSDAGLDSNADGFLNTIAFTSGAGPQHDLRNVLANKLMQYEVNSKGSEVINLPERPPITVDIFQMILRNMTAASGQMIPINQAPQMRFVKWSTDPTYEIPYSEQLLGHITLNNQNTLFGLARMIDQANPEQAYWRFYKQSVPITNIYTQPQIDLSLFKLLRARDRTN